MCAIFLFLRRTLSIAGIIGYSFALSQNVYHYSVDLTNVKDDKLTVTLIPPYVTSAEIVFRMPRIVPGTYEVYNFGRFVSNFSVFDKSGNRLSSEKTDENTWRIAGAGSVGKITYQVEDTWDTELKENFVFEPAGSGFEENKNFILNTHAVFGYIDGLKSIPFHVEIKKPSGFYGSTGISSIQNLGGKDVYTLSSYMELVDSPILYCPPDTTMLNVGGTQVLVSVYSPNKKAGSKEVAKEIWKVLNAQKEYLGGKLPVSKYAFLIYLFQGSSRSGATGALEHSYSSFYYIQESNSSDLAQTIIDFGAHEFFHIVTPLNIHSEEIGNFDFNNPVMSRHLWMYEGVTEYFAGHVQVKHNLITPDKYLDVLREKIITSGYFNDSLPFTELSLGCLDKHKDQYGNVYYKGALIGMSLDIRLRSLSEGKYGLQELMRDLSKTYGKEKSFSDTVLFSTIRSLTWPEIGEFLENHVSGSTPLPLEEIFSLAGIHYFPSLKEKRTSFGGFDCFSNEHNRFCIQNPGGLDEVGQSLGYKSGDLIVKINGKPFNAGNAESVLGKFKANAREGDPLTVTIKRKNEKGKYKKMTLKSTVRMVDAEQKHILIFEKNPTEKQLRLRNAWLGTQAFPGAIPR